MEKRFTFKDLIVIVLLIALIISVWIAMKQYDRQWDLLNKVTNRLDAQGQDLRGIREQLGNVTVSSGTPSTGNPTTTQTTAEANSNDPFARMRAARAKPNFAMGDWMVESFPGGVAKLTPLLSADAYADDVQSLILETLATRDPATLEWKPLLAKSWKISDDGLTITFVMRDGVHFSDGTPLTVDDVVYTYDLIMNEKIAAPRQRAYYAQIDKVEKVGSDTVVFHYKQPYFEAFDLAASISVMPKHFYSKYKPEEFNQSVGLLLGSGPYKLESPTDWKPGGDQITAIRNDRYWGVQPPFDRRVFKIISNDKARLTSFRNGEIDIFGASPEQYRDLLKDPSLLDRTYHFEYLSPASGYRFIAWNQKLNGKDTFFTDKRVRQAMTMLIDRQRYIQDVMLGYAVEATGPFNPLSKQCDPNISPWPNDIERAKKLLADVGYRPGPDGVLVSPNGMPFQFKLTYPSGSANYEKMGLLLKDAFAKAGIVLVPDPLEWSVFTDRLNNKNFEAISLGWTAGIETDIFQMFHSSQMVADGDDFMSYKSEELDKVIDEARRTVDEPKRMELWHRAHQIIWEDQPYTFLSFGKALLFVDKRFENIEKVKLGINPREEWYVPTDRQRWTR